MDPDFTGATHGFGQGKENEAQFLLDDRLLSLADTMRECLVVHGQLPIELQSTVSRVLVSHTKGVQLDKLGGMCGGRRAPW